MAVIESISPTTSNPVIFSDVDITGTGFLSDSSVVFKKLDDSTKEIKCYIL